ncbi:polysaccharide biosynthesis protein [Acholeplasma hippikon]|uniref:UDP-glucose 4-epimerase n=1 Tax=Acholeplasma hippikon TaxID=264636 RepID=A0A449BLF9_9MOLU|nr:nucleoside-diphosphate sugar epimerase/dehydratase [Acholeplasma hippikon]VEU83269.1 UDP-glucose 4-epimerase [Acholeplasma hippikon]
MFKEFIGKTVVNAIKYIVLDIITILLSYYLTIAVLQFADYSINLEEVGKALLIIIPAKIVVYIIFGVYRILTKYTGFEDILKFSFLAILTNVVIVVVMALGHFTFLTKTSYIFITTIEIAGLALPRVFRRAYRTLMSQFKWLRTVGSRTLIIGAGEAGEMVLKEIFKNKDLNNIPVAFVDDNEDKFGRRLMGVEVVGTLSEIDAVIEKYKIEEVIIAVRHMNQQKQIDLVNHLIDFGVTVKKINLIEDFSTNKLKTKLIDINVEELLNRDVIKLDNEGINEFIKDKVILVTGGGGSIGSELCRQIFNLNPTKLVIFDIYENNAYDIQMELQRLVKKHPENKYPILEVRIGSVYNRTRLEEIFKEFKPNVVFHAAAYKHVPLMEDSAVESVRTNVLGTFNAAQLSTKYGVEKFVLISSDKAVRSTNVMGACKRLAEMVIEMEQKRSNTKFSAVRFGNVLGSNGSVIPLFKKQIADGGPVTVTHKDITRYFMTIPEAVSLILQCAVYADKAELFILDMGEPVRIYDLAEKMIKLAGLKPNVDIDIEITGLRPGEKLYEELLVDTNSEQLQKTQNTRIFKESTHDTHLGEIRFLDLITQFEHLTNDEVKEKVSELVGTYQFKKPN